MNNSNASISSIPVELQYAIAKCCGLDYTAVFNLLCLMPGLKTYVEAYKHLKQELTQGFLEVMKGYDGGNKVSFFVKGGVVTGEHKKWHVTGELKKHSHYKNNKLNGEYKKWYSDGQIAEYCFYKNDKLDGEYKRWNAEGQLETHCFYKNDSIDGEYKRWYCNGQLFVHFFSKNDVKDGEYNWWRIDGELIKHRVYLNGVRCRVDL